MCTPHLQGDNTDYLISQQGLCLLFRRSPDSPSLLFSHPCNIFVSRPLIDCQLNRILRENHSESCEDLNLSKTLAKTSPLSITERDKRSFWGHIQGRTVV